MSRVTSCLLCPKKTSLNRDPFCVAQFSVGEDETPFLVSLTTPFFMVVVVLPFDSRKSGEGVLSGGDEFSNFMLSLRSEEFNRGRLRGRGGVSNVVSSCRAIEAGRLTPLEDVPAAEVKIRAEECSDKFNAVGEVIVREV